MTVLSQFSHTLSLTYSTRQQQQSCLMRKASLSLTLPRSFSGSQVCLCVQVCVCLQGEKCRNRKLFRVAKPKHNQKREPQLRRLRAEVAEALSLSNTHTNLFKCICMLIICKQYAWPKLQLLVRRTKTAYINACVRIRIRVLVCLDFNFSPCLRISDAYFMVATCCPLPPTRALFFCVFVFVLRVCENNPRQLHLVINMALAAIAICFWLKPPPSQFSFTRRENI